MKLEPLAAITGRTELAEGQITFRKAHDFGMTILPEFVRDSMLDESNALTDAGWRMCETHGLGTRYWVRLTGKAKWLAAYATHVAQVEYAEVTTEVVPYGDTFSIVAGLGEADGRGWVRVDTMSHK